jgi:hypothetical protein
MPPFLGLISSARLMTLIPPLAGRSGFLGVSAFVFVSTLLSTFFSDLLSALFSACLSATGCDDLLATLSCFAGAVV